MQLQVSESVRGRMREDHRTLRGLLVMLSREASSACAKNAGKARLRMALTAVRDALLLHLDDEDAPRLRSTRILNAHEAQRASAIALVEDADEGSARNLADLADEIAWFVTGLERDMELEETLAETEAPR